jgi:hypothetical protein
MSDESSTVPRGAYAGLPVLTEDNFADWDMQVFACLTGSSNHARVFTPVRQPGGAESIPKKPEAADPKASAEERKKADEAIAAWEKSERLVLACFMGRLANFTVCLLPCKGACS